MQLEDANINMLKRECVEYSRKIITTIIKFQIILKMKEENVGERGKVDVYIFFYVERENKIPPLFRKMLKLFSKHEK